MAYSKLHSSVVNSSLWCSPDPVRLLFITFLAICDADGCVYGSRGGIARQANIKYPQKPDPFDVLLQPDPDSSDLKRHPENQGRRIIEIEGGFQLINYGFYRALRNSDDRKVQNREAQQRFRAKHKPPSASVSQGKPRSAQAEAEAEAKKKKAAAKPPTPEDWLKKLESNPAYKGINVRALHSKMIVWCEIRGLQPTLRRLVTWLNREDKPMSRNGSKPDYKRNYLPPAREPSAEEIANARAIAKREADAFRAAQGR